jgi:hypothetical protein
MMFLRVLTIAPPYSSVAQYLISYSPAFFTEISVKEVDRNVLFCKTKVWRNGSKSLWRKRKNPSGGVAGRGTQ